MSLNPYIKAEVEKVFQQNPDYPKNYALASAWIIANFKGINIKIFDVTNSSSLCDYNIIASAQNVMQARSMAEEIQANLKAHGGNVISLEGIDDGEWILCDMGDVIIHIFQEISREIFNLDELWGAFPTLAIPAEYYFGSSRDEVKVSKSNDDPTNNYF